MSNDISKSNYKYYISKYDKFAELVREICATPDDCGNLFCDD